MKIPLVEQHDSSDCGAACVASICEFYGKEMTIMKLRDLLGTNISGVTVKGLVIALEKLGFNSKAVRVDTESFESEYSFRPLHIL